MIAEMEFEWLDDPGVVREDQAPEVKTFYRRAVENSDVGCADCLTIRDLVELSGANERGTHALLLCMFQALNEGSLCLRLSREALERHLNRFAGDGSRAVAEEILSRLGENAWASLVAADMSDFKPLIIQSNDEGAFLYFQKFLKHAAAIFEKLGVLLAADRQIAKARSAQSIEIVRSVIRDSHRDFNTEQKIALYLGLLRHFLVISGGPGTGKTWTIVALLRCLVRSGVPADRILLAAPTGRAGQRITESIRAGLNSTRAILPCEAPLREAGASTIHRLLRFMPSRNAFACNASNPLPADVVVVDEVSMVDVRLMSHLLAAIDPKTRVIFLGDTSQLPPVEAGAAFSDLLPASEAACFSALTRDAIRQIAPDANLSIAKEDEALTDRFVILTRRYRSGEAIVEVAGRIDAGDRDVARRLGSAKVALASISAHEGAGTDARRRPLPESGCWIIEPPGKPQAVEIAFWRRILDLWATRQYLETPATGGRSYAELLNWRVDPGALNEPENEARLGQIFAFANRARILTLVRRGPYGCVDINRRLAARLRETMDRNPWGELFSGALAMISQNDYSKDLFNGDIGVTLRGDDNRFGVVFPIGGRYRWYPVHALPPHEPAFAITVHKSQGSEYEQALLVLPDEPSHRMLTREIVYTGLTRARELALIYGRREALEAAIANKTQRESGVFRLWKTDRTLNSQRSTFNSQLAGT